MNPPDPTEHSLWRPLRQLLDAMDDEIARVYAEHAIPGLRPTHVREILRLHARGPMTISALAGSFGATHSATSQKVAAMRADGWVVTGRGADARARVVELTPAAREVVPRLGAEWRATEAAVAGIEAEIPYPLTRVVDDVRAALERTGFGERILAHLADDPAWG